MISNIRIEVQNTSDEKVVDTKPWPLDCSRMDEVTRPKLYHLDSCSIRLPVFKTVFVLGLSTIKIKTLFSGSSEVGKLASLVLSRAC